MIKRLFIIFNILILVSMSGVAQDITNPAKYIEGDDSMYKPSEVKDAVDAFNSGVVQQQKGKLRSAIQFYKMAVEADQNYVQAYDNMGVCYRRLGDAEKAIEVYKKSIFLFPRGTFAHINLALVYSYLNYIDLAILEYDKVLAINPSDPEAYYGLAMMYMKKEKYDKALLYAEICVRVYKSTDNPMLGEGEYLLGQAHYMLLNDEEARKYFKLAIEHGIKVSPDIYHFAMTPEE